MKIENREMARETASMDDRRSKEALDPRGRNDKEEANTTAHVLAHSPKKVRCIACRQAKVTNVRFTRSDREYTLFAKEFGDRVTADTIALRSAKDRGIHGETNAIVLFVFATGWLDCIPVKSRKTRTRQFERSTSARIRVPDARAACPVSHPCHLFAGGCAGPDAWRADRMGGMRTGGWARGSTADHMRDMRRPTNTGRRGSELQAGPNTNREKVVGPDTESERLLGPTQRAPGPDVGSAGPQHRDGRGRTQRARGCDTEDGARHRERRESAGARHRLK